MNKIQMFASSSHLRLGLHRVLATAHALQAPLASGQTLRWWEILPDEAQPAARDHSTSLEELAGVYGHPEVRRLVDDARRGLGLPPLDHAAVAQSFRAAIISGKAHRAHMGRDIYGNANKGLWDQVCGDFGQAVLARWGDRIGEAPVRDGQPSERSLTLLRELTALDTSPSGDGNEDCVAWLVDRLGGLGFEVQVLGEGLGRPMLVAHRVPRGLAGHVVLYGHYDVTPFGNPDRWLHPPHELTLDQGRLFARGVGDNKGPLACRLAALEEADAAPELTWLIQGEEETGSRVAKAVLPEVMASLRADLWLDETGYHDHEDGTLRLLGRKLGPEDTSLPPDVPLDELMRALRAHASRFGVGARHELRGLNKSVVEGGCPFNHALPLGARYLALGVNDSSARIHALNESVPGWTFPLHTEQLDVVFRWVDRVVSEAQ